MWDLHSGRIMDRRLSVRIQLARLWIWALELKRVSTQVGLPGLHVSPVFDFAVRGTPVFDFAVRGTQRTDPLGMCIDQGH